MLSTLLMSWAVDELAFDELAFDELAVDELTPHPGKDEFLRIFCFVSLSLPVSIENEQQHF
jgi:hypothetical protein